MIWILLFLLLLILLFGGLGVFVARLFLIALLVTILAALLVGFFARGSFSRRRQP